MAAAFALVSGAIVAALLFAGLGWTSFAVGLVTAGVLAVAGARRSNEPRALSVTLGYSVAFVVLGWPLVLIVAFALWGRWE